jgi:hypothetical protein
MFLAAFFVEVALITYRGVKIGHTGPIPHMVLPSDYAGAAIVYGLLGLLGKTKAEPVAAAVAWGFVVATLLNLWTPKTPVHIGTTKKKAVAA